MFTSDSAWIQCIVFQFTTEFTAHKLHSQRAGFAAHGGQYADVLSDYGWLKQIGFCAVIIQVSHKNLPGERKFRLEV